MTATRNSIARVAALGMGLRGGPEQHSCGNKRVKFETGRLTIGARGSLRANRTYRPDGEVIGNGLGLTACNVDG